jgi:DNA mismatch endonuclease (patch repair protein)
MANIRRRDTQPELVLRRALRASGLGGYRLDVRRLPGRPDVAWIGRKIAVFVDGAFWHGHPSAYKPGKSGVYWDAKIERNVKRDRAADQALAAMGWTVLRLWDFEVLRELDACIEKIRDAHLLRPTATP